MREDQTRAETDSAGEFRRSPRQRAIDAYGNAGRRTTDTLSEAPLLAIAGGLAAGALIAALLPRTRTETRAVRPTAKRVRETARDAYNAARETGTQRFGELGLSREKGEETIRSLFEGVAEATKASGKAALEAARKR